MIELSLGLDSPGAILRGENFCQLLFGDGESVNGSDMVVIAAVQLPWCIAKVRVRFSLECLQGFVAALAKVVDGATRELDVISDEGDFSLTLKVGYAGSIDVIIMMMPNMMDESQLVCEFDSSLTELRVFLDGMRTYIIR